MSARLPQEAMEQFDISMLRAEGHGVHDAKRIARGNRMLRETDKISDDDMRTILAEIVRAVWRIK